VTRDTTTVDLACVSRRLSACLEPLLGNASVQEKLEALAAAALDELPGVDGYGVWLVDGEQVSAAVISSPLVAELHDLEQRLAAGPAWETLHGGDALCCEEDLAAGDPSTYRGAAGRLGVRSQAALRVRPHKRTLGVLTVVSTTEPRVPLDQDSLEAVGRLVAILADQAQLRAGIEEGLRGRTVIGQAMGIAMERYRMTEDLALSYLKRESSTQNRKLREIAERIVAGRG
jgi:GAF domain-containing protein